MAFGGALIGRGWSGQFVRIGNVWLGEVGARGGMLLED